MFELVDSEESAVDDFVLVQFYEEPEYNERTLDVLPGGVNLEIVIPVRTERFGAGCISSPADGASRAWGVRLFPFGDRCRHRAWLDRVRFRD